MKRYGKILPPGFHRLSMFLEGALTNPNLHKVKQSKLLPQCKGQESWIHFHGDSKSIADR